RIFYVDWHSDFVGRGADLDVLKAAWDEASSGTPRVVAIVAESGFGKTRLAQEFYNWLSTHHDGVGEAGYWPDQLMREADNLRVNPSLDDLGDAQMTMPFLWWGLRLADPGARNAITNSALGSGLQTLNPHLAAMQRELERAEIKRRRLAGGGKTATELALDVGETAFEVVSSVGTFGILGLVKTLGEAAWDHRSANQELKALDARDVRPGAANQRERDLLAETVITDLARLCKNPAKGIDPVPIVLLVDDVQWLQTDDGTASFLDLLMARARAEAWPLMLLMTSWRREWRASQAEGTAPGTLTDLARGDIVHDLGPLEGLDKIIRKVLPGLTAVQVDALSEKAEGTPRFMDEMLMYLIRRRKAFVNRSTTDALTEAGLEDVLARDFAEFVADRLEQAPEYVRRALAIASMQGVSFSPRLVYRLAQGLSIVDAETGLSEGDDPHSFITGAHVAEGSEFRLRAYRTAAREDLGNLLDEVEAEETLRAALLELTEDVLKASDQELTLILNAPSLFDDEVTEWRNQIIAAGVVLIDRANKAFDTRKAGYLAERLLPLFEGHVGYEHPVALLNVIDAAFEWCGPDLKLVPPLERLTSQIREELEQYELLTNTKLLKLLSNVYSRLGEICKVTHGPEKGLECDVAALELERYFVQHEPNDERYLTLSLTLGNLTRTFQSLGYYDEARKYGEEALELLRALCEKNGDRGPWSQLAQMLGHQGDYIAEKEGEASTIALRQEEEAILRRLLEKNPTTNLKRHLALTLGRMSKVFTANGDRDAALAAGEEELALLRKVIEDAPTLSYRRDLALSLGSFSNLVTNTKGLEASLPYNHEAIAILEDLFEESELLALTGDLSIEYGDLSRSVEKLEGPAAALPLREKATQYARDWVAMSDIPKRRRDLSISLDHLATLVNAVHGAAKALPLREEQVMVLRSCVAEEADPNDPVSLAYALAHVSELVKTLEGPEPARVYAREEEALLRAAVDAAPNQSTELGLANALQRLTTLTEDIEGARDALPICTKRLALVRDIHRREPTSQSRSHLYSAVADLASMTDFLDGAQAGLPLWAEA
ncbi:MAG: AAA family ATPase, partial [Pseudomonadota bacterium]